MMAGEDKPEHVLVEPEDLPERSATVGLQREHEERVVAVAVLLDGVGEFSFAPAIQ